MIKFGATCELHDLASERECGPVGGLVKNEVMQSSVKQPGPAYLIGLRREVRENLSNSIGRHLLFKAKMQPAGMQRPASEAGVLGGILEFDHRVSPSSTRLDSSENRKEYRSPSRDSLGASGFMYDVCLTNAGTDVTDEKRSAVPLAAIGAFAEPLVDPDMPLAYIPRAPDGRTFRELLERAVGWGRR